MIRPIRIRRISMWMLALALVMLLSFSLIACARDVANQGGSVTQNTQVQQSTQQSAQPASAPAQSSSSGSSQVQDTDQQVQQTLQSLDNAQNDVNAASSQSDNEQQP